MWRAISADLVDNSSVERTAQRHAEPGDLRSSAASVVGAFAESVVQCRGCEVTAITKSSPSSR